MHFLSEHDYDRKKVMLVLQGNQKSAVRFALWKRLKELEKSISTQLQPVYKSHNGQHWNPNLRAQIHVICLHITVETVFRGHPSKRHHCFVRARRNCWLIHYEYQCTFYITVLRKLFPR